MNDGVALIIVLFGASVFGVWNLYWGLRNKCVWLRVFPRIDRRNSPWNYWVAIAIWTIWTVGCLAAFIGEL